MESVQTYVWCEIHDTRSITYKKLSRLLNHFKRSDEAEQGLIMELPCFNDVVYIQFSELERYLIFILISNAMDWHKTIKGECLQSDFPINCYFTVTHTTALAKRPPCSSLKSHMHHCAYCQ